MYTYFVQPIFNIEQQRAISYELLLRTWDATERNWRLPDHFDIDADTQLRLMKQVLPHLKLKNVTINLTTAQFADASTQAKFIDFVNSQNGTVTLTVELVKAPSLAVIQRMAPAYHEAGILIAIDDVGSDNTYDETVDLLPFVDTLKFAIQNLRRQGATLRELRPTIINWMTLAQREKLRFTLEGIETRSDLEMVASIGVSRCQGFFYSKPVLPDELQASFL